MKYSVKQEQDLLADVLAFADDPCGFVHYMYPWGQKNTPLERETGPRKWQKEELCELREHVMNQKFYLDNDMPLSVYHKAICSGRGPGKSCLAAWLAHWHASTHLGASTIITANTETQVRTKTFAEIGKWVRMSMNEHWFNIDAMKISVRDWLGDQMAEQLKLDRLYWNVIGQNWSSENPDAFAGTHNTHGLMVIYDEASGIPAPIWRVTSGFFTELTPYRFWLVLSNGRRNAGAFFDRFARKEHRKIWKTRNVNALDVEGIDHGVHLAMIEEHGEHSDVAKVEVYGMFPEMGEDQFISSFEVRGAQNRELPLDDEQEPLIMGVDPAPRGRTVIRFRRGRDARSIAPVVLRSRDNTGIADSVVQQIGLHHPDAVVVDAGQGTGVIDDLKRRRVQVFEVWMGSQARNSSNEFLNLGSELWGEIRDWLPGGCIDDSPDLFRDLTVRTWRWAGREDSKKIMTPKDQLARDGIPSPDDADALCLTFYPRLPRKGATVVRREGITAPGKLALGVGECVI